MWSTGSGATTSTELVAVAARVHAEDHYPIFLPHGDFVRFLTRASPVAAWVAVRDERIVGHVALNAETSGPVMRLAANSFLHDEWPTSLDSWSTPTHDVRASVGGC